MRSELWMQIMSPSKEKNEMALSYAIAVFLKNIRDNQRQLRKKVNLRVHSAKFRIQDPCQALAISSLWTHFSQEFKKLMSDSEFASLEKLFMRGALDKELLEKLKLEDPELKVTQFSFLQTVTGKPHHDDGDVLDKAQDGAESAQLALLHAKLKKEQNMFRSHKRAVLDFDLLQKSSRAAYNQQQETRCRDKAEQQLQLQFPVRVLGQAHVQAWFHSCTQSFAESLSVNPEHCFHIFFANLSCLGSQVLQHAAAITRLITDGCAANPSRTGVALVC